jgi:hypothetical protein
VSNGALTPERVLNELSAAASSPPSAEALLATLARRDAELREEVRVLQDDVVARARDARRAASGDAATAAPTWAAPAPEQPVVEWTSDMSPSPLMPPPPYEGEVEAAPAAPPTLQLRDAVEELRAEVARTRAAVRSAAAAAPPPPPPSPSDNGAAP